MRIALVIFPKGNKLERLPITSYLNIDTREIEYAAVATTAEIDEFIDDIGSVVAM